MFGHDQHPLQLDRLMAGQKRALELAVAGAPLGEVLEALALALEEVSGGRLLVSVLLASKDGRYLRHGAAPSLPPQYVGSLDGLPIHPDAGPCAAAAVERRRVVVDDLATDQRWPAARDASVTYGLRSCWATPILSSRRVVLGTVGIYQREPRLPTQAELDTVDLLAHTAALAIERDMSAAALAATHERYRLVVEAAHDAIRDWELASGVVEWSAGLRTHFGHAPADAGASRDWWIAHVHPADATRVSASLQQALGEGREVWEHEYRFRRGDGTYATVLDRSRIVRDAAGHAIRVVGALINVTERQRAQARDRFLVQLDDALRPLKDPREITQRAATVLGQYLRVSRCAYAEVEEDGDTFLLTGNHVDGVHDITGCYAFSQFGAECHQAMRAGVPFVVSDSEADPRVGAGSRGAYAAAAIRGVICVPVLKEGQLVAAMAVHTATPRIWKDDEVELVQQVASRCWESIERARLTRTLEEALGREQRAREEADAERHRAESANRAKDEFLAMLGHELRNPLSPIRTALQLMKLRGSEVVQKERAVIERQVGHLTRLVDDLLDVSRIARGQVELRLAEVAVSDAVTRAVEAASPVFEERGHHLTVRLPDVPLMLTADGARLQQVLTNLLTNAAKYTDPGGDISVTAERRGGEVVFTVADTGRGIAADTLPHIFDLFVQERQGSDRAEGGLGLGLTIVRTFVERHGGRVEAHSAGLGRGSEFTVRLPLIAMPSADTGGTVVNETASRPGTGRRVLVVDDNEDGAAMLAAVLDARGHAVRVAHDGPTALELAETFAPDIALLDIGLPVMDGYELAVRLRESPTLTNLTLVALTGYGQAGDRARARAAGFNHHLVKPVDLDAVDRVLK